MSGDLFKEIDADMQMERLRNLMHRYAKLMGGVVVIILFGIGEWQFKLWQDHKETEQASASYLQIMQQIDPVVSKTIDRKTTDTVISQLNQLAKNAPESIRVLARFKEAALLAKQEKVKEASLIWDEIRFDGKAPSDFRSLASVLWIQHHLDNNKPVDLYKQINELVGQQTPWHSLLRECEALLDLRTGKLIEARQIFGQLSTDMYASPNMRKRANMMLQVIASNDTDKFQKNNHKKS